MRLSPRLTEELSSASSSSSDVEMLDIRQVPLESVGRVSRRSKEGEEDKDEEDYNIEWKVFIDKNLIISDLISRSDFRFSTLCINGRAKAQAHAQKKNKDIQALSCKAHIAGKRRGDRVYEILLESKDSLAKVNKIYK